MSRARTQLEDSLGALADAWGTLLGTDVAQALRDRIDANADAILANADAATASALLTVLWGSGEVPASWWGTPLGRAVRAQSPRGVTQAQAADILGVTRGTIAQLVSRGTLERTCDGHVSLASVLDRLER
jgi:hypothetical protein